MIEDNNVNIDPTATVNLTVRKQFGAGEPAPMVLLTPDRGHGARPSGRIIIRLPENADLSASHISTIAGALENGAAAMLITRDLEHAWQVFRDVLHLQQQVAA